MPALYTKVSPVRINLLPGSSDFGKTGFGKILLWALSIGRYIVVFTELIVIMAFLARFKLDRDLTDLHEAIEQKKAIVASASSLEINFRNLQKKLSHIEEITNGQIFYDKVLNEIAQFTPIDTNFSLLDLDKSDLKISGVSLSEMSLASLLFNLRNSPKYTNIEVTDVKKSEGSPEILFSLTANIAPENFKE